MALRFFHTADESRLKFSESLGDTNAAIIVSLDIDEILSKLLLLGFGGGVGGLLLCSPSVLSTGVGILFFGLYTIERLMLTRLLALQ